MLRAPTLLIAILSLAVPEHALADTKAEKAAKKKKKDKAKKEKADKEKADAEAEAEAEAPPPDAPPDAADADLLKTKADTDAEAEAEAAKAEAEAAKAAQDKAVAEAPPPPPPAPAMPPLLLGKGRLQIGGQTATINLSSEAVAEPISLTPGIWYGITAKLSVGVTHDGGTTRWTPRPAGVRTTITDIPGAPPLEETVGSGICVTGEDAGCPKPYDNVGVDALIGLADGKLSIAIHPGVDVTSIADTAIAIRLGVLGRFAISDKLAVVFDPRIAIRATERDVGSEQIDVPVWFWLLATDKIGAYLQTGISGPTDGFGDAFAVPVGLGASLTAGKLILGADFQFGNLLGNNGGTDTRLLGVRLGFTL